MLSFTPHTSPFRKGSVFDHCKNSNCVLYLVIGVNAFNPLNAELNTICHSLALLGAHHILHVSGLRVNVLAFRYKVKEMEFW